MGFIELLLIVIIIVLLFNTKRLVRLAQAFRRSKTEYQQGLEEPQDVEARRLPDLPKETKQKQ